MKLESRRLRSPDDKFFTAALQWRTQYPRIYREMDALQGEMEDLAKYANDPEYIHIGISADDIPVGLLTFRHAGDGWFEAHLDSKRGFSVKHLEPVAWEWGWGLFEMGAYAIYAWGLDSSKAAKRAADILCLTYDGTVRWIGVFHDKVVRSKRHTLYRHTWLGWQNESETNGRSNQKRGRCDQAEGIRLH
jgi:hypothetical protein